jgi:hypothetical protein
MNSRLEFEPDDEDRYEGESDRPRGRSFMGALVAIAVVGIAGGSYWAYHSDKNAPVDGPVPIIHSDDSPVKEAPKNPGGMVVPYQDSVLLNREGRNNAKVEQLLPDPEPVLPRPVAPKPASPPPQQQAAAPPPPQAPASPPLPAPIPATTSYTPPPGPSPAVNGSSSAAAASGPPATKPPLALAAPPKPPVPPTQAAPAKLPAPEAAPAKSPTPNGSGYRLQLGALKSEDAARAEWERLKKQQPDILGKLAFSTSRVDLGADKGIYYRIQAGPIADAKQATQNCAALKSRNVGCILVKP